MNVYALKQMEKEERSCNSTRALQRDSTDLWEACDEFFSLSKIWITLPLSCGVINCLPDWPYPPAADLTTGRSPLSTPERWHWPRAPLWQPAHVHRWPLRVCQCRHPPPDQPGPAALHHHTCSGHDVRPLRAGHCRYVWRPSLRKLLTLCYELNNRSVLSHGSCRFSGFKPCHG